MDDFTLHERSGRHLADLMSPTGDGPPRSYTPAEVRALWPQADAMARGGRWGRRGVDRRGCLGVDDDAVCER